MRLRTLRRSSRRSRSKRSCPELASEAAALDALLASDRRQWRALEKEVAATQAEFGGDTPLGRRRTLLGDAPDAVEIPAAALVERESGTTVLCARKKRAHGSASRQGPRGHRACRTEIQGRRRAALCARWRKPPTALVIFGSNGTIYDDRGRPPARRAQAGRASAADDRHLPKRA